MNIGKLSNEKLEELILKKCTSSRVENISAPKVGEDCAFLDMGGDLTVLSTDPITAATKHIGRLSVHVNCNDAAAAGADPVGLMVTLLIPPHATEEEVEAIADDLIDEAKRIGVDILGGHTEVTDAVTRFVTNTTVVARVSPNVRMSGMSEGDDIVMTKYACIEGSVVIASEHRDRLTTMTDDEIAKLLTLENALSVVPEGRCAIMNGASAMHDITEGGVYGALHEMAHAASCKIVVDPSCVPILPETVKLCEELGLEPMRLLSSGSMLIACKDSETLIKALRGIDIPAVKIACARKGRGLTLPDGTIVPPPGADEIYRV